MTTRSVLTSSPGRSGGVSLWQVVRRQGQLRLHYGSQNRMPQVAALHLRDSYLRLSYGPGCAWGTSIMLAPALWYKNLYHHGTPVDVTWAFDGNRLQLDLRARIIGLGFQLTATIHPPTSDRLVVDVEAHIDGTITLDPRPVEAFKPVFLSSMRVSPDLWDCCAAIIGDTKLLLPNQGWIVSPSETWKVDSFGLEGGSCDWKTRAPTVYIDQLSPRLPVIGWVTASDDPDDDNVGLWAASETVLSAWSYRIIVKSGDSRISKQSAPCPRP